MRHLSRFASMAGMAAIVLGLWIAKPDTFITAQNLLNISQQISMLVCVASVMTLLMVTGDFDLSVGSMASLSGVVAGAAFVAGWPVPVALVLALGVGVLGGLINGFLVAVVGLLPFVATLATLTAYSGIAFLVSNGRTISGRAIPDSFGDFARGGLPLGIWADKPLVFPALTLVALAVACICWILLEKRRFGRWLYAIGSNAEAARLSGVPVWRTRLLAFVITGLMIASRVASANPTQGDGIMLNAIAAVFLGMTLTANGQPRVLATIVGVVVMGMLDNGLTQLNVNSYVRQVLVGVIIVLAVSVATIARRLR
jgi:ribose transport system permease protein